MASRPAPRHERTTRARRDGSAHGVRVMCSVKSEGVEGRHQRREGGGRKSQRTCHQVEQGRGHHLGSQFCCARRQRVLRRIGLGLPGRRRSAERRGLLLLLLAPLLRGDGWVRALLRIPSLEMRRRSGWYWMRQHSCVRRIVDAWYRTRGVSGIALTPGTMHRRGAARCCSGSSRTTVERYDSRRMQRLRSTPRKRNAMRDLTARVISR